MSDPTDPARAENWLGSGYDLAIECGPADDDRLDRAVWALSRAAKLGPATSGRTVIAAEEITGGHLLARGGWTSVVDVPGTGRVACKVLLTRTWADPEEEDVTVEDTLGLCLPLGAVALADPRVAAEPYGWFPVEWSEPVDDWFVQIAHAVFEAAPFDDALMGFDAYGEELADAAPALGRLVPDDRGRLIRYRPAF